MTNKQRFNRFKTFIAHLLNGERRTGGRGIDHLKSCDYCRNQFEKWEKEQDKS